VKWAKKNRSDYYTKIWAKLAPLQFTGQVKVDQGAAMKNFHASGENRLIEVVPRALMLVQKNLVRKEMVDITANVTVPAAAGNDALPELRNPDALEWVKTIPGLGKNSPEYAILHVDPHTRLTTLMFRTPVAVHIKAHTHDLAESLKLRPGGGARRRPAEVVPLKVRRLMCQQIAIN